MKDGVKVDKITNKELEGYRRRLNSKGADRGKSVLIPLLYSVVNCETPTHVD